MSLSTFFLNTYEMGEKLILSDINSRLIAAEEIYDYINFASNKGKEMAYKYSFLRKVDIDKTFEDYGIKVNYKKGKKRIGNIITYSEYYSKKKSIVLYTEEINQEYHNYIKETNNLVFEVEEDLWNVFKLHEFYHHLECHEIGITHKLLPLNLQKKGLFNQRIAFMSLSEIAANCFAKEIFNMKGEKHET